jgi:hypothetical protein
MASDPSDDLASRLTMPADLRPLMSFVLPERERRYPCRPIEHARFVRLLDVIALLPADMMTLHSLAAPAILRETTGVPVPAELLRCMSRVLARMRSVDAASERPGTEGERT